VKRLSIRGVMKQWAERLQAAYSQAIRSAAAPKAGGVPGGSLGAKVRQKRLVRHRRWGFVFKPIRIGERFLWWWKGTKRQQARGRGVPLDERQLVRDVANAITRQVKDLDRRAK